MAQTIEQKAAAGRKHYAANKAAIKARARAYTKANRKVLAQRVREAKDQPCVVCGNEHPPRAMDLHHVRGIKRGNVPDLVNRSVSLKTLNEEIEKCDVYCAVCHRLAH